jgi:transposase
MNEQLTICHERVEDLPLLLAQLDRRQVAPLLDECFPTHGNWKGVSVGQVVSVWLACMLSEAKHRMSHVEPWAAPRLQTLSACLGTEVRALDCSDDRLAQALDYVREDAAWQECERQRNQHTVRVYDLCPQRVRIDATTATYYGRMTEDGLLQCGHSTDPRAALPQLQVHLSALDPLGLPLTTTVVRGNCAEDPRYVPEIPRVQASLGRHALPDIGEAKMAALETRAYVAARDHDSLGPLPATHVPAEERERLLAPVWEQKQARIPVVRPAEPGGAAPALIAEGYESSGVLEAPRTGRLVQWPERRLVVRSVAYTEAQRRSLVTRRETAQAARAALQERRQGKKDDTDTAEWRAAGAQLLARYRVRGLLRLDCQTSETQHTLRRYGTRPARVPVERTVKRTAQGDEVAVARAQQRLGWRVYATHQPAAEVSLEQAVLAYREAYLVERGFGRLQGKPWSLAPLYLDSDERVTGLLRVLLIALRVLCLRECSVRRQLHAEGEQLAGISPGNPRRATARPTREMMLHAFEGLTLTTIAQAGTVRTHLTPLSPVQHRILPLLGWSPEIYVLLAQHASKPLFKMSEP